MTAIEARDSFDAIAANYDDLWSKTDVGYWQRQAVWDTIHPLFRSGDRVLDVGCGTGVDALSLMAAGVQVLAVDESREMVQVARSKGLPARHLPAEQLDQLRASPSGITSDAPRFGWVTESSWFSPFDLAPVEFGPKGMGRVPSP